MEAVAIRNHVRKFSCQEEQRNGVMAVWAYGAKRDCFSVHIFHMTSTRSHSGREHEKDDAEEKETKEAQTLEAQSP